MPMIIPMTRTLMWNISAITAPITSDEAARVPQPSAASIAVLLAPVYGGRLTVAVLSSDRQMAERRIPQIA